MLSAAILGGLLMTTGFSWQAAVVGGIGGDVFHRHGAAADA